MASVTVTKTVSIGDRVITRSISVKDGDATDAVRRECLALLEEPIEAVLAKLDEISRRGRRK